MQRYEKILRGYSFGKINGLVKKNARETLNEKLMIRSKYGYTYLGINEDTPKKDKQGNDLFSYYTGNLKSLEQELKAFTEKLPSLSNTKRKNYKSISNS